MNNLTLSRSLSILDQIKNEFSLFFWEKEHKQSGFISREFLNPPTAHYINARGDTNHVVKVIGRIAHSFIQQKEAYLKVYSGAPVFVRRRIANDFDFITEIEKAINELEIPLRYAPIIFYWTKKDSIKQKYRVMFGSRVGELRVKESLLSLLHHKKDKLDYDGDFLIDILSELTKKGGISFDESVDNLFKTTLSSLTDYQLP